MAMRIVLFLGMACGSALAMNPRCTTCNASSVRDQRLDKIKDMFVNDVFGFDPDNAPVPKEEHILAAKFAASMNRDRKGTENVAMAPSGRDRDVSFHLSKAVAGKTATFAAFQMWMHRPRTVPMDSSQVTIEIFRTNEGPEELVARQTVSLKPRHIDAYSVELNTYVVQEWLNDLSTISLTYRAIYGDGDTVEDLSLTLEEAHEHGRTILLSVDVEVPLRKRRSVKKCSSTSPNCCLIDAVVDFAQMGWKHVLAPQKFNAFACVGSCGNHNRFTGAERVFKSKNVPQYPSTFENEYSCCHVTSSESLTVTYLGVNNEIVSIEVQDMVALGCACS